MHTSSYNLMKEFKDKYYISNCKVLDVGSCDVNGTYKDIFDDCNYTGCDICEGKNVDIILKDAYNWREFKKNSFDVVISGSTFEHIEYPWLTIREIYRVLKINGYCCIISPMIWDVHSHPVDCYRYNPDGLRALFKWVNMQIIDCYSIDAIEVDIKTNKLIENHNYRDCICIGIKNV